jgi:hypothetical protein
MIFSLHTPTAGRRLRHRMFGNQFDQRSLVPIRKAGRS